MPIQNVIINSTDVAALGRLLHDVPRRRAGRRGRAPSTPSSTSSPPPSSCAPWPPRDSTWVADDLQRGFRHVGFKVDRVDPRADVLKAAGVPFHLDPLDAEGGVRICFFYDPDGTLLELVEGDLQYAQVLDADGVAAERALGVPERPRFDHVAVTVDDRAATDAFYRPLGFSFIGTIEQPHDPRGFSIGYLKSGATVLEVFTYEADKQTRDPQPDAPGFGWAELAGTAPTAGVTPSTTAPGPPCWPTPTASCSPPPVRPRDRAGQRRLGPAARVHRAVGHGRHRRRCAAGQHARELRARGRPTTTASPWRRTCWSPPSGCSTPPTATAAARASAGSARPSRPAAACRRTSSSPPRSTRRAGTTPAPGSGPASRSRRSGSAWTTCRWSTCTTRSSTTSTSCRGPVAPWRP